MHAHGPSNVLDLLFAHIFEGIGEFVANLIPHHPRDANPTRLRKGLQPGRYVHGVAEQIVALNDDIADVDAYSKPHLLTGRSTRILLCNGFLYCDRTLHGVHSAGEIGENAVPSRAKDPTPMRGDQPVDNGPVGREGAKGADLISAHQAAISLDIGCEDRGELPFDPVGFQNSAPPRSSIARSDAKSECLETILRPAGGPYPTWTGSPPSQEIATHRLGQRAFETYRCKPSGAKPASRSDAARRAEAMD